MIVTWYHSLILTIYPRLLLLTTPKIDHIGQIRTVWTNTEKYTVSQLAEEPYDAFASDKLVCRTHTIVSL
jgi:hypothetical protein